MEISRKILLLIVLTITGFILTLFPLPLFYGVDFLFGSIAAFIALKVFGIRAGVLVAVIAGSSTILHWGHPYFLILSAIEFIFLGIVFRLKINKMFENIPSIVGLYWLVLGLPLVTLTYHYLLTLSWNGAIMIAFKQGVNEILNSLLAYLIIHYLPLNKWFGMDKANIETNTVQQFLTNLMVAFAFLTTLLITVLTSQNDVKHIHELIEQQADKKSSEVSGNLLTWRNNYLFHLNQISRHIAINHSDVNKHVLQGYLNLINDSEKSVIDLRMVDKKGTIISIASNLENISESRRYSYQDQKWFQSMKKTNKPVIRLKSQGFIISGPHLIFATSLKLKANSLQNDSYLLAMMKGSYLKKILENASNNDLYRISLINKEGKIIASSNQNYTANKVFHMVRGGVVTSLK
ncbi:MAG: cache domain-containing protein, partial [Spirochaetota bacterium]|nr:cache domain-containing protein [Spirochaetota bacterium]